MSYRFKSTAAVVILAAAAAGILPAQSSQITGLVKDPSGAAVSNAEIEIRNPATGVITTVRSNESGYYTLPYIAPGQYEITVRAPGFRPLTRSNVVIDIQQHARLDVELQVGDVLQSIVVAESVPRLETERSAVGAVVKNQTIANLPIIDRKVGELLKLNGFVTQRNGPYSAVAGGRGGSTVWVIDGGIVQKNALNNPDLEFDPPVESIEELNVMVANYAAEFGRSGGGVVTMTTKSGTNDFHGSAYEYLRNDVLEARTFFAAVKPPRRYNLFGASLGGPIVKNRAFFFYNYEGLRVRQSSSTFDNVPARAELGGDFSQSNVVVRDPTTRSPFPGNLIPQARLDPVGARIAQYYPEPNVPGRPSGNANFLVNVPNRRNLNTHIARADYNLSARDRIYGRYLGNRETNFTLPTYPTAGVDSRHAGGPRQYDSISATWFRTMSAAWVNELRYAWMDRLYIQRAGSYQKGLVEAIGLKGVDKDYFPAVGPAGYASLGSGGQERVQTPISSHALVNTTTAIRGNHTVKFGVEYRTGRNDDTNRQLPSGRLSFNNVATGHSIASLLLGWVQSAARSEALTISSRSGSLAWFAQDDWKVTPRLTLNFGLRWDSDQPRWESNNRQNSFHREAINPVCNCPGVVTFSGRGGLPKFAHDRDWNNFAPRLGFSWRATDNTVVRGGGSILYTPLYSLEVGRFFNLGFSTQGDFVSPDNGITPAFLLSAGMPPIPIPSESDLTPGFGAVPIGASPRIAVEFLEPGRFDNGYLETFNFNIQRQLPGNTVVEVGWVGNLGHKLSGAAARSINQVRPELMGPGNAQVRRPFPQFSDVRIVNPPIGNSSYHGVNFRFEKRYSHGLQLHANYTWSKLIDDVRAQVEITGNPDFANYYDRRADRGLANNHVGHRFILSGVGELPFGRNKAVKLANPVVDALAGGWSVAWITELRTGTPYGVTENVNRTNAFSQANRSMVVGKPDLPSTRPRSEYLAQWFDVNAFAAPPDYAFGNAGRSVGIGPGAVAIDASLLKTFTLRENHKLQCRAEMLNLPNHPNFANPNSARGRADFGRITGLAPGNASRIIQLALRYSF
jgi:outer membrane receptor protein involved in Fe transport